MAVWIGIGGAAVSRAAEAGGPTASVRLELLLGSDRVMGASWSGPVWSLSANPGRRLVQLPMRVEAGEAAGVIGDPPVDFAGGRFLGWTVSAPGSSDGEGVRGRSSDDYLDLTALLAELDAPAPRRPARAAAAGGAAGAAEGAPRVTRELTVIPAAGRGVADRVAWDLDRSVPNGTLRSGDAPYLLLLDRDRLRAKEPARPGRLTRNQGESTRDFAMRRRESDAQYRAEASVYRDLTRSVRGLPDRFEQPLPETVWAVFEVSAFGDGWSLRGHPAGPWEMRFDDWDLLTKLARSGRGGGAATGDGRFSAEEFETLEVLDRLARQDHPWTQRLLAEAVASSGYAGRAAEGGPAYSVLDRLLRSDDPVARNRTVYTLVQVTPATPAAASLLAAAAPRRGEPAFQLAALRAQLSEQLARDAGPVGVAGAVRVANDLLRDPDGPDAGLIVRQLLAMVPEGADADAAVIGGVRFDGMPAPRFDAAVAAALRAAGRRPGVVGGWLNRQLLGANDPAVVDRTLALLERAGAPAPTVGPAAAALRRLVFGPTEAQAQAEAGAEAPPVSDLTLTAGLPLDSANHAIFRLLNSGDPELRRRGWLVLRHFELTDSGGASTADDALDPLTMIVNAGLGQAATPPTLVSFLDRQPERARADGPLVRVVLRGDPMASRRASRALRGSERALGPVLSSLSADDRALFAQRVYDALGDGPEPVTGLMRADPVSGNRRGRGPGAVVAWFGRALAGGELPTAEAWAAAAGGERGLMPAAVGRDEALAHGALAGLTASAGGDRAVQFQMIERFKVRRTTQTAEAFAETWGGAKQDIYRQRLRGAAGEYRLVIVVTGDAAEVDGRARDAVLGVDPGVAAAQREAAARDVTRRTVLGVTELRVTGQALRFTSGLPALSVPTDRLAIRVNEPGQLKSYPAEALKELPLDEMKEPLDLLPHEDGAWVGEMTLPDGRGFTLVMEPLGGAGDEATPQRQEAAAGPEETTPRGGGDLRSNPFR
ncbi:MAG: hypothetical protein AAF800_09965 [Planctomycetota bacterium]